MKSRQDHRQVDGKESQEEGLEQGSGSISKYRVFNASDTIQGSGLGDNGQGWNSESPMFGDMNR